MTTIILAAGQGRRLRPITERLPKCLVPVGGAPILAHALDRIQRAGHTDVLLVTGFEADRVRSYVKQPALEGLRVRLLHNPRFADTNNLYSLALALHEVDRAITVINGDDLFNVHILAALQASTAPAAAAVDFSRPLPRDAMKTAVEGCRVTALGKEMPSAHAAGNAIGLYRFSARAVALLREEVMRWLEDGRLGAFYVAAISALAGRVPIEAVSIAGLTWCEVDDALDLAAAPQKLRQIVAEEQALCLPARPLRRAVMTDVMPRIESDVPGDPDCAPRGIAAAVCAAERRPERICSALSPE